MLAERVLEADLVEDFVTGVAEVQPDAACFELGRESGDACVHERERGRRKAPLVQTEE